MKKPVLQLYGRRLSRPLGVDKNQIYEDQLKFFKQPLLQENFWKIDKPLYLEIGFGGGEHLAQKALKNPHIQFIGAEPFVNGVASLLQHIEKYRLTNVWIWDDNIHDLFSNIKDVQVFDAVYLLFADPWPKKKHFKRRFIQNDSIKKVHQLLKNDASWYIATDHLGYRSWMLELFEMNQNIFKQTRHNIYERPLLEEWPLTRYEEKARNKNIPITYMIYKKI